MQLPGRPNPTTFEYIEAIALREPDRIALVQDLAAWDYVALYLDLQRVMLVLDELGVRRGDRVAVGMSGFQAGVLLLVALENLGAASLSFMHRNDPDVPRLFELVDWVFSDSTQQVPPNVKFVAVDESFVTRTKGVDIARNPTVPRLAPGPAEPVRISRTSGSTGRSKFMVFPRRVQEWWIQRVITTSSLDRDSRVLLLGPLVLNANLITASACLRTGATAIGAARVQPSVMDLTNIVGLPLMIEQVLATLPPGYVPRRPVDVTTMGGFLSAPARESVARTFGGRVRSRYGTNEAGGICEDMDVQGIGVLAAGVDVRILDESGRDLPPGQLGVITVRTPGMVEEYIGEPEASRIAFRDGWFHSGDWGTLVGPRVLRLAGRFDDLVNIGGVKVAASQIEAKVRELAHPRDCAVLAVNLDGGATTLGIALVMETPVRGEVRRAIAEHLDVGATVGARVLFLPELPRMGNGKIDRVAIHRLFEAPPPGSV